MEGGTESLRSAAPKWSLAGDKDLLEVLQNLHQRIISKCQETNRKLDEMVTALDDASVHLQNVNNKFTSLSNRQFIESRVYDDDTDVMTEITQPKETPKEPETKNLDKLKQSLQVLESLHESVTILCDSDSDTVSDEEEDVARVVLKPKDLYADRPLPHIIGSNAWKSKWHAGLLPDDSDSDSGTSKHDTREIEQYSDSEPDTPSHEPKAQPRQASTISSSSPEIPSDHESSPCVKATQSDIAAELARRLGGAVTKVPEQHMDVSAPTPTVRKLYKPEKPIPATVFLDEPPPLSTDQSEESDQDIFAEINKTVPYNQSSREQNSVVDDLFGIPVYDDVDNKIPTPQLPKQKSTLFDDESEPELFVDKPKAAPIAKQQEDISSKKPIGGKSLFGSNAESIGAAILKRNQQQSSTSDDESDQDPKPQIISKLQTINPAAKKTEVIGSTSTEIEDKKIIREKQKERDIFDDLFARSEKINRRKETKEPVKDIKKKEERKVDLFSDNLFDDVDDLFVTKEPVVVKDVKRKEKSIFDVDDDLFSDIAVHRDKSKVNKDVTGDIFDENSKTEKSVENKLSIKKVDQIIKETQSLFDDSHDDIFSDVKASKSVKDDIQTNLVKVENEIIDDMFTEDSNDDLFKDPSDKNLELAKNKTEDQPQAAEIRSKADKPSIFDDEDDDLFKSSQNKSKSKLHEIMKTSNVINDDELFKLNNKERISESSNEKQKVSHSNLEQNSLESSTKLQPEAKKDSLFDDDLLEDDLFSNSIQNVTGTETKSDTNIKINLKPANVLDNKDLHEHINKIKDGSITAPVIDTLTVINEQNAATKLEAGNKESIEEHSKLNISKETVNTQLDTKADIPEGVSPENVVYKDLENIEVDTNKNDLKSITHEEDGLVTEQKDLNEENIGFNSNDTKEVTKDPFADIFNDMPPVFEKPKEPKKSKNINALFDDDSDDEALFFKKNDVIDEKPASFSSSVGDDKLFGLFMDEPPAIDVDFIQKPTKEDLEEKVIERKSTSDDIFDVDTDFTQKPVKSDNFESEETASNDSLLNEVVKNPEPNIFEHANKHDELDSFLKEEDNLFKKQNVDNFKSNLEQQKQEINVQEPKKVGKLKPMNFNINVNTLLPGASPKKTKPQEQTDGQTISTKSNEELRTNTPTEQADKDAEPKLVKSVSFDGEPDSPILDNKLSKERAKIQVKRRPSTRRARREAVKKSGIDFGQDSTDNSSSIDDVPKTKPDITNEENNPKIPDEIIDTTTKITSKDELDALKMADKSNIAISADDNVTSTERDGTPDRESKSDTENIEKDPFDDIFAANKTKSVVIDEIIKDTQKSVANDIFTDILDQVANTEPTDTKTNITDKKNTETVVKTNTANITSKVVYVLNDEDIFNTKPLKETNAIEDVNIFDTAIATNIQTLGKVYPKSESPSDEELFKVTKTATKRESTKNLFNDLDDDALFKRKTTDKQTKQSIFGSDSEEELFFGKKTKKEVTVEKEPKKIEVKGSLFGDDDDDELFGIKTKINIEPTPQSSKQSSKESAMSCEPVFQDPLTLLGDDED